jgi:hypothetical protein
LRGFNPAAAASLSIQLISELLRDKDSTESGGSTCAMLGAIIEQSPRRGRTGLVFSMCSGKAVVGFSLAKRMIDEAAVAVAGEMGVAPPAPWRLHDVRRSVRTRWSAIDVPDVVKELGIAHSPGNAVRQTYDRYGYHAELRSLFEQWESRLASIVGGNVVVLRTGGRR